MGNRIYGLIGILALMSIIATNHLIKEENSIWHSSLISISLNIIASIFIFYAGLLETSITIKLYAKYLLTRGYWKNKELRVSIAYLYRIKFNDKYLLVKNQRFTTDTYQPVGGVYKYFPEAKDYLAKLGVKDDTSIEIDHTSRNDLRIRVPRKNIFKLIDWFIKGTNREYCHWREFQEELVKTGILPKETFPHISTKFVDRVFTKMEYSEYFKTWEIKIFDIIEPKFTLEQENVLKNLHQTGSNYNYVLLNSELIERLGNNPITKKDEYKLGTQTKYIL